MSFYYNICENGCDFLHRFGAFPIKTATTATKKKPSRHKIGKKSKTKRKTVVKTQIKIADEITRITIVKDLNLPK